MAQETNYTEENIRSLDWKEHIRMRPGMYIGKLAKVCQTRFGDRHAKPRQHLHIDLFLGGIIVMAQQS